MKCYNMKGDIWVKECWDYLKCKIILYLKLFKFFKRLKLNIYN